MKCREVNRLLVAYLDNEVTPSERALIQAHLAECERCREELAALLGLRSRVSQFLKLQAAQATPSPQAWSRLQACLRKEARPSPSWLKCLASGAGRIFEGGVTMWKKLALTALVAMVIALSVIAFVPSVRAQVGEAVTGWFYSRLSGGGVRFRVSSLRGILGFTPLQPTYLPSVFQYSSIVISSGPAPFKLVFHSDDQFVTIAQSRAPAGNPLPAGINVMVGGQRGVLVTGLKGTFEWNFRFRFRELMRQKSTSPIGPIRAERVSIPYEDGKRLVWYVGDVRVEMLSNLPVEEMLKIAESMVPAEVGEDESPFGLSPELLPGGGIKLLIIQEGPIGTSN